QGRGTGGAAHRPTARLAAGLPRCLRGCGADRAAGSLRRPVDSRCRRRRDDATRVRTAGAGVARDCGDSGGITNIAMETVRGPDGRSAKSEATIGAAAFPSPDTVTPEGGVALRTL